MRVSSHPAQVVTTNSNKVKKGILSFFFLFDSGKPHKELLFTQVPSEDQQKYMDFIHFAFHFLNHLFNYNINEKCEIIE